MGSTNFGLPRRRTHRQVCTYNSPPFQTNECKISKFTWGPKLRWVSVPCLFHTCSIPVPDRTKYLAHTHPVSLVGTSKIQSLFQALRIKCAIQTLRIRQHGNVHAGHMVLTSSHFSTQLLCTKPPCKLLLHTVSVL